MLTTPTLTIFDVMLTSSFWEIILFINSPLILLGLIFGGYKYWKSRR